MGCLLGRDGGWGMGDGGWGRSGFFGGDSARSAQHLGRFEAAVSADAVRAVGSRGGAEFGGFSRKGARIRGPEFESGFVLKNGPEFLAAIIPRTGAIDIQALDAVGGRATIGMAP